MMFCRFADLVVESEIELDCLDRSHSNRPDCVVRRRPVRVSELQLSPIDDGWSSYRTEHGAVVAIEGLATFEINTATASIDVDADPSAEESYIAHLVADHMLPMFLVARGARVLHATAAVVDGRAVAIAGKTGTGKSTMVSALARAGYELIADDCLIVERGRDGRWMAQPSYPATRLRSDSVSSIFGDGHVADASTGKALISARTANIRFATAPTPLSTLVCLKRVSGRTSPSARHLPSGALAALVGNSLHGMTMLGPTHIMLRMSDLATSLPVVTLEIPDSLDRLEESMHLLLAAARGVRAKAA